MILQAIIQGHIWSCFEIYLHKDILLFVSYYSGSYVVMF